MKAWASRCRQTTTTMNRLAVPSVQVHCTLAYLPGTILPLLHSYRHGLGHAAPVIHTPQSKQRSTPLPRIREGKGTNPPPELESTAPRIRSDFRPRDEDLIQGQKRKQWRRERRLKRIITAALGWLVMGWMIYLMMVTARSTPKIWDPYNILDISRVRYILPSPRKSSH